MASSLAVPPVEPSPAKSDVQVASPPSTANPAVAVVVKISDVKVAAVDFFAALTTVSSQDLGDGGLSRHLSVDYANDASAALGLATDLNIHRVSKFFDHLTSSRAEYEKKMQTYHLYTALRNPAQSYSPMLSSSDLKARRSLVRDPVDHVRIHRDESGFARDPSTVDMPWSFNSAQTHILETIQASTVPKPKKKKKKKKKKRGKLPSPTPDIMTPEEASLNYQTVVMEERIRQELAVFEAADKECSLNEERLTEIRKRYDQELQACKAEFLDDEAELKALEDEWSLKIREGEANIAATKTEITETITTLEAKIAEEERSIASLRTEIAAWIRFREGPMVRNKAKNEQLIKAIEVQKQNRADHLRLTDEAVHLAEENAKRSEEKALNDLCQRHLAEVSESLPPEDIQEIENNDILSAELVALTSVFNDLTAQTDALQRKIIHQAAAAQTMLESVNMDNAKIAKKQLFNRKTPLVRKLEDLRVTKNPTLTPEFVYQNFQDLHEIRGLTGGLSVVGTAILSKHASPFKPGTGRGSAEPPKSVLSTTTLQPGFLLKIPDVNLAANSTLKHTNLVVGHEAGFLNRMNEAIVQSKQKTFLEIEITADSEVSVDAMLDNKNQSSVAQTDE